MTLCFIQNIYMLLYKSSLVMYNSKHTCARGRCDRTAQKGDVVCKKCMKYLKNSKTYSISD